MTDPILEILDRLIRFDTVSANSNLALIDYVQDFLTARGFDTHRLPDETGQKAGLFARLGPAIEGGILLSAHSDVVPVEGQVWSVDPFRLTINDNRLFGRGACDMKGYLAAMLVCADKAREMTLTAPLMLSISYDEEIGCVGIQKMKARLAPLLGAPRVCFVGEPTQMQVAIGHKGKAAYRAHFKGNQGHSAMAPQFVNALHMAMDFGQALRNLQRDFTMHGAQDAAYDIPHSTVHMGKLSGGTALNMIPDVATMEFELRHLASDLRSAFEASVATAASQIAARYQKQSKEAAVEIEPLASYPGLDLSTNHEAVIEAQTQLSTHETIKVSYGTEAGVFAELGLPTIVCGPGSMAGQGHKPDEFVELGQLQQCQAMLGRMLDSLAVR